MKVTREDADIRGKCARVATKRFFKLWCFWHHITYQEGIELLRIDLQKELAHTSSWKQATTSPTQQPRRNTEGK